MLDNILLKDDSGTKFFYDVGGIVDSEHTELKEEKAMLKPLVEESTTFTARAEERNISDVSTSVSPEEYQMFREFNRILLTSPTDAVEDGLSPLVGATREWIEKYGTEGVKLVKMYITSNYQNIDSLTDIMEMFGDVNNQASYEERRTFLESNLQSSIADMRYGAVLGLANMHAEESISFLKESLINEEIQLIANTIKETIKILKDGK